MTEKRLQLLLRAMSLIATTAGTDAVLRGAQSVSNAGAVATNVDSEFRFYAAWYVAAGALLWNAAAEPQRSTLIVRASSGALLTAAVGRILSWRSAGRPSRFHQELLMTEAVLGAVLPVAHYRLLRGAQSNR